MRISRALCCLISVSACKATEGDVLRTKADAAIRPQPAPLDSWQIQLTGALDTSFDVRLYTADVTTPASVIADQHSAGRIMICYFSAGTVESFRDDAGSFPPAAVGASLAGYPDERWVDVRDPTVRAIMQDRITNAAAAGCDGIHPSGLAGFFATTGFTLTRSDQLAYDRWLAAAAHAVGLSIGFVETDGDLANDLVTDFDWAVAWSCIDMNCAPAAPFVAAQKAAFLVEYGDQTLAASLCPKARALGLSAIIKRDANLDAFRVGCL